MNAARPEAISNGERDVIFLANLQDFIPVLIGKVLPVVSETPLGVNGAASGDNASEPLGSQGDEPQKHSSMNCKVVNSLLSLPRFGTPQIELSTKSPITGE